MPQHEPNQDRTNDAGGELRHCPALLISAPASGQGKTTVTAALARYHRRLGRDVRVFKTGPDFIDPTLLEQASGNPVYQLDLWMGGEDHCRRLLYEAAASADLILVEGVMGLFDGDSSSADLAARFGMPVLAVIDAGAMAQTFGALAHGLASYRPDLPMAGVLANRVGSAGHYEMVAESLPPGLRGVGWLPREAQFTLPERHLGLVQAAELEDLDQRLERAADALQLVDDALPAAVPFAPLAAPELSQPLAATTLAVARDAAFSFVYRANLDLLRTLGAELRFFSPLADTAVPKADALYLPGGYPELHLARLAANESMKTSIRAHHDAGKPLLAECGGMLYLLESLTDRDGHEGAMVGLLPGRARMQERLVSLGMQAAQFAQGELRGHTFHHSAAEMALDPVGHAVGQRKGRQGEALYRHGSLLASYVHWYFPANPAAAAALFQRNKFDL